MSNNTNTSVTHKSDDFANVGWVGALFLTIKKLLSALYRTADAIDNVACVAQEHSQNWVEDARKNRDAMDKLM